MTSNIANLSEFESVLCDNNKTSEWEYFICFKLLKINDFLIAFDSLKNKRGNVFSAFSFFF